MHIIKKIMHIRTKVEAAEARQASGVDLRPTPMYRCGNCRQPGHNVRTCPEIVALRSEVNELRAQLVAEQVRNREQRAEINNLLREIDRLTARLGAMAVHSRSTR